MTEVCRILITAGPTHEPIDTVRFLGNRSSGRLGIALADRAAARGHTVTLLLGPVERTATDSRVRVERFRTTADLQALLRRTLPEHDILIMAAAVADYRPLPLAGAESGKVRRLAGNLMLELVPTPDLLAEVSGYRRADHLVIGFALEPHERLRASALDKLSRKRLDAIVANPLETMDADTIEATVFVRPGLACRMRQNCDVVEDSAAQEIIPVGRLSKDDFASFLLDLLADMKRNR